MPLQPLIDAYDAMVEEVALVAASMASGESHGEPHSPEEFAGDFSDAIFLAPLSFAFLGLLAGLAVLQAISTGISFGLAPIILSAVLGLAASLLLSIIAADVIATYTGSTVFEEIIPDWYDEAAALDFAVGDFLLLLFLRARQMGPSPLKVAIVNVIYAFWLAFLSLVVVSAKAHVALFVPDEVTSTVAKTILDGTAAVLALFSLAYGIDAIGRGISLIRFHHWLLIPLSIIFTVAALATSFSGLLTDIQELADRTGNPLP